MAKKSNRGRIFIYLALILILVVVLAVWVAQGGFSSGKTSTAAQTASPTAVQEQMVDIVITTQSVTRGTPFTANVLTTIKYPKKNFIAGTFYTSVDDVIGKLAKVDLDAQVPLTKSLVVETGSITAEEIPAGMVAISIPLTNRISSVSYAPQAGDHVNIIAAMTFVDLNTDSQTVLPNDVGSVTGPGTGGTSGNDLTAKTTTNSTNSQGTTVMDSTLNEPLYIYPSESQRPRLVSQTLLQDVIVLGVGNFPLASTTKTQTTQLTPTATAASSSAAASTTTTTSAVVYPDTITVIVSPQDAVTLNYLIYAGAELTLVLRSSGDSQRVQTEAVTLSYLMQQYNIPLPDKLAYGTDPRVDVSTPVSPLQLNSRYSIP